LPRGAIPTQRLTGPTSIAPIHAFDKRANSMKSWFFGEPVVALSLTGRDDELLLGPGSRLIFWNLRTNSHRDRGFRCKGWPDVRLNERFAGSLLCWTQASPVRQHSARRSSMRIPDKNLAEVWDRGFTFVEGFLDKDTLKGA
jgi:hypothetical protein